MHPEITKRFIALEARRKAFVERVKALPQDKQTAKPNAKSFSPAEVVMHLAIAEQGNLGFLQKAPPPTLKGKKTHMTFIFKKTVASMQKPVKPIMTPSSMIPKGPVNVDEAARVWEDVRRETAKYLEQVATPDEPFIKFLFFFGLGSAADYLTLLEAHMTYHEQRFPQV